MILMRRMGCSAKGKIEFSLNEEGPRGGPRRSYPTTRVYTIPSGTVDSLIY